MTNPATMPEAVLPTSRSAREASRFSLQGFFRSRRRPAAASLLTLANLATLVLCSKRGIRAMGPCRNLGGAWADHQIVSAYGERSRLAAGKDQRIPGRLPESHLGNARGRADTY